MIIVFLRDLWMCVRVNLNYGITEEYISLTLVEMGNNKNYYFVLDHPR